MPVVPRSSHYVVPTDWNPPPFQYKDADEITVLAGRYHKGGHSGVVLGAMTDGWMKVGWYRE